MSSEKGIPTSFLYFSADGKKTFESGLDGFSVAYSLEKRYSNGLSVRSLVVKRYSNELSLLFIDYEKVVNLACLLFKAGIAKRKGACDLFFLFQ
jgi:hypothetical protein